MPKREDKFHIAPLYHWLRGSGPDISCHVRLKKSILLLGIHWIGAIQKISNLPSGDMLEAITGAEYGLLFK